VTRAPFPVTRAAALCALFAVVPTQAVSQGGATLREARIAIVFSPSACDVTARYVVDTADPAIVEHRLMLGGSVAPPDFAVIGSVAGNAQIIGNTARVPISVVGSGRNEYSVRYRFTSNGAPVDRCPLLVPSAPTDGLRRSVTIDVRLPSDATRLPGEFPLLAWEGLRGAVTLGHVPSFVRAPHVQQGERPGWRERLDARRVVDVTAVLAIAVSTAVWIALRKRPT
jgi:hypothetical protein